MNRTEERAARARQPGEGWTDGALTAAAILLHVRPAHMTTQAILSLLKDIRDLSAPMAGTLEPVALARGESRGSGADGRRFVHATVGFEGWAKDWLGTEVVDTMVPPHFGDHGMEGGRVLYFATPTAAREGAAVLNELDDAAMSMAAALAAIEFRPALEFVTFAGCMDPMVSVKLQGKTDADSGWRDLFSVFPVLTTAAVADSWRRAMTACTIFKGGGEGMIVKQYVEKPVAPKTVDAIQVPADGEAVTVSFDGNTQTANAGDYVLVNEAGGHVGVMGKDAFEAAYELAPGQTPAADPNAGQSQADPNASAQQ